MRIDRRDLLRYAVRTPAALMAARLLGSNGAVARALTSDDCALPAPDDSGIEHVVFIMMENRSFDHFMGWLPNADGLPPDGQIYLDRDGNPNGIYPLAPDYTGEGFSDPNHSYSGSRVDYNNGAMDGFLRAGGYDIYSIGYYVDSDHSFLAPLALQYTTCDRYFSSFLGPTFPNRLFAHSAQTDRLSNTSNLTDAPTIWDRLADAGISGRYYAQGTSFLLLWGPTRYRDITRTWQQFLDDAASGTLPAVAFVDPRGGFDDHPHADIRVGDNWLNQTFSAINNGPAWPSTVVVITFDEGGGFFDHVAPPRVVAPNSTDPDVDADGNVLLGFRVPAFIASPFSVGNPDDPLVSHLQFDHTSVLKLIEWRWGLSPLTARDASDDVGNLACALNFGGLARARGVRQRVSRVHGVPLIR